MHGMATPVTTRTTIGIFAPLRRLVRAYARWRQERQTMMVLTMMDDALLKDIGICRSEITWVARSTAFDPERLR